MRLYQLDTSVELSSLSSENGKGHSLPGKGRVRDSNRNISHSRLKRFLELPCSDFLVTYVRPDVFLAVIIYNARKHPARNRYSSLFLDELANTLFEMYQFEEAVAMPSSSSSFSFSPSLFNPSYTCVFYPYPSSELKIAFPFILQSPCFSCPNKSRLWTRLVAGPTNLSYLSGA